MAHRWWVVVGLAIQAAPGGWAQSSACRMLSLSAYSSSRERMRSRLTTITTYTDRTLEAAGAGPQVQTKAGRRRTTHIANHSFQLTFSHAPGPKGPNYPVYTHSLSSVRSRVYSTVVLYHRHQTTRSRKHVQTRMRRFNPPRTTCPVSVHLTNW